MLKRIACAMSGGVDSTVAAVLLRKQGFDVVGVFMKNWEDDGGIGCTIEEDWNYAKMVAQKLNIPLYQVNFVKEYWHEVFQSMLSDYLSGFTPNPDILCNRKVKFGFLLDYVSDHFDADVLATGHYARISRNSQTSDVRLLTSVDERKDQTFFLSQVQQKSLQRVMFPIGGLLKHNVKRIAEEAGLERISKRNESMGICFIGQKNYQKFISEYLPDIPGDFVDIDTGHIVGNHRGFHYWTIGQRCRIAGYNNPYFAAHKELSTNIIYVAAGHDHPLLLASTFYTDPPFWIHSPPPGLQLGSPVRCSFRFQHSVPLVPVTMFLTSTELKVCLDEPLRAITPGQFAVFYQDSECLGSAQIQRTEESSRNRRHTFSFL